MWIIADAHDYHCVCLVIKCALRHAGADKVAINTVLGFDMCSWFASFALIECYEINAHTVHFITEGFMS